ncbi:PREDICTED: kelch repeat and BTB domain-containing protein 8-like [Branchiostoma belcheri]|uniref:Kelch repeat and BTB domain-containing protein 8-like n=1 Tax=Branchiostoma belcheri TaxID=7741 RepID=A0A6P4YLV3_BRABE|nr:PREDICTED: kelch repeat and BTB domain-containing protein 8-like [Branchiostoma belcheri]
MAAADQETHASSVRPRSYQDESYQHGFLGAVGDLQKEGELQDVVLEVEGRRFPCHRLVLSAASPYFRAMFTSDMAESRQNTVVLQGLDADMFEEILSYIYSGTLHVSLDRVQPLYQAADLLQLDYVRDTCSSYMAMNVERSTCVDLYKFADVFRMDVVLNSCLQYICQHFVEVSSSEEFCSLSVNQLTEIISQDKLEVKEETRVWEAVVRWVQHSREDRLQHLPSILPCIRFNLLTSDDMAAILEHSLVREDHGSSELIRNVVQTRNPNLKPRLGMTTEMVLLYQGNTDEVMWMNPGEKKFIRRHYNLFPVRCTIFPDNEIYILAELEGSDDVTLHMYNHVEDKWEQKSTVYVGTGQQVPRHYLVEVDGHLFHLLSEWEGSVFELKKYNQNTNEWHNCSTPQQVERSHAQVAVSCNQRIYLFSTNEMHWYDPREDRWTRKVLSEVEFDYDLCSAVAMGTEIFCTDNGFTKMLVYYTEADSWSEHSGLPDTNEEVNIECCTLFVLQNKLRALVGCNDFSTSDSLPRLYEQVYVYDRSEDVWRESSVMPGELWDMDSMNTAARMYLPHLNTSHEETQGVANPEGPPGE